MSHRSARPTTGESSSSPEGVRGAVDLAGLTGALFEQSPFSTALYDASGRLLVVNEAFTRLWGLRLSDVPAGYNVLHDEQLERQGVVAIARKAFAGEMVVSPPAREQQGALS